jgi:hypothetical protein
MHPERPFPKNSKPRQMELYRSMEAFRVFRLFRVFRDDPSVVDASPSGFSWGRTKIGLAQFFVLDFKLACRA